MTIYIEPAIVAMFLLFGLMCFLIGVIVGRPDKQKEPKIKAIIKCEDNFSESLINANHKLKELRDDINQISCRTCKKIEPDGRFIFDGRCDICVTDGLYSGYERRDIHG